MIAARGGDVTYGTGKWGRQPRNYCSLPIVAGAGAMRPPSAEAGFVACAARLNRPNLDYTLHMESASIQELLSRNPFIPFRLKLSNQDAIEIRNPDLVVVMRREVFVAEPSRDGFRLVSLVHVVSAELLQAA